MSFRKDDEGKNDAQKHIDDIRRGRYLLPPGPGQEESVEEKIIKIVQEHNKKEREKRREYQEKRLEYLTAHLNTTNERMDADAAQKRAILAEMEELKESMMGT